MRFTTVWELAVVQACIIHLTRNTFRLACRKYWDQIAHDLRHRGLRSRIAGPLRRV
jgi:transposase-like protein